MARHWKMLGGERREPTPSWWVNEDAHASSSWVQKLAGGGQAKPQSSWGHFRKPKQSPLQRMSGKKCAGRGFGDGAIF